MLEIEIPTKLYIKRYLQVKYGETTLLTRKCLEGSFLYELLEDPRQDRNTEVGTYAHILKVSLPDRVLLRKGFYLTPTQLANWNSWMERYIKAEMRSHIDLMLRHNPAIEIRHAISDYQELYQLHDDFFPFDSIKKDYYRYRLRIKGEIRRRRSAH